MAKNIIRQRTQAFCHTRHKNDSYQINDVENRITPKVIFVTPKVIFATPRVSCNNPSLFSNNLPLFLNNPSLFVKK